MTCLRVHALLCLCVVLSGVEGCSGKRRGKSDRAGSSNANSAAVNQSARRAPPPSRCANRKPPPPKPETLPSVARALPAWARSLKVMAKTKVYQWASKEAPEMGRIKMVSRLPLLPHKPAGDGCKKYWLKLEKGAWVCGEQLRPDRRAPLMKVQPLMKKGSILPGLYAWVRKGGAKTYTLQKDIESSKPAGRIRAGTLVRWLKTVPVNGVPYWYISKKLYLQASRLLRHYPSKFKGIEMRKEGFSLPVAIVRAKTRGGAIYDQPGGKIITRVPHHSRWEILDKGRVGITKYYRIKPGWIAARRVISAWPSKPPAGLRECEKWVEVVVNHQSLVAYEGDEPVYMTMISSGDMKHPTKYGVFRVWWKKAQADMASTPGMAGPEFYRVDDVPWAIFFWRGIALHGAYWHTDFGNRRSHGCINLAPRDAKWLYDWTEPAVPPAWLNRRANERQPGTLIRVRHKLDHEPPFRGYARKLAPKEAVRALDESYKERMRSKSLELIKRKSQPR